MPMPEAAVDQNNFAVPRQHHIGPSGKVLAVEPETIPQPMQQRPDRNFRLGVPAADAAHEAGALLWRQCVDWGLLPVVPPQKAKNIMNLASA